MMKRKFLAVVLPIIGCATVVGSGFSAWYFGTEVATDGSSSTTVSVDVTNEIKGASGTLSVDLTESTIIDKTLILDQGGFKNTSVDSGIMFGDTTSTVTTATGEKYYWNFTVSYDGTYNEPDEKLLTIDEIYDAGLRIRVEMSVTIDSTLKKYIDYQAKDKLPKFKVSTTTPEHLGKNPDEAAFDDPTDDKLTGARVITANYIVDATKLGDSVTNKLDLNFSLDLNTEKIPVEDKNFSEGTRIDYSNKLFVYKQNATSGEDYTGGKPVNGKQLAEMAGESFSPVVFKVVAYIEDDPTK